MVWIQWIAPVGIILVKVGDGPPREIRHCHVMRGCVIVMIVTWSVNTSAVFLLTIYIEHGHQQCAVR